MKLITAVIFLGINTVVIASTMVLRGGGGSWGQNVGPKWPMFGHNKLSLLSSTKPLHIYIDIVSANNFLPGYNYINSSQEKQFCMFHGAKHQLQCINTCSAKSCCQVTITITWIIPMRFLRNDFVDHGIMCFCFLPWIVWHGPSFAALFMSRSQKRGVIRGGGGRAEVGAHIDRGQRVSVGSRLGGELNITSHQNKKPHNRNTRSARWGILSCTRRVQATRKNFETNRFSSSLPGSYWHMGTMGAVSCWAEIPCKLVPELSTNSLPERFRGCDLEDPPERFELGNRENSFVGSKHRLLGDAHSIALGRHFTSKFSFTAASL